MSHTFTRIEKDQTIEREEQLRAQRVQAQLVAEQQANQAKMAQLQQTLQQQTNQLNSAQKKHKQLASQKLAFQVSCIVAVVLLIAVIIAVGLWRASNKASPRFKPTRSAQPVSSLMTTSFDS